MSRRGVWCCDCGAVYHDQEVQFFFKVGFVVGRGSTTTASMTLQRGVETASWRVETRA